MKERSEGRGASTPSDESRGSSSNSAQHDNALELDNRLRYNGCARVLLGGFDMKNLVCVTAFLLLAPLAFPQTLSPGVQRFVKVNAPVVALTHVRVIDGTGAAAREDQTVVLSNGKIAEVSDAAFPAPPTANRNRQRVSPNRLAGPGCSTVSGVFWEARLEGGESKTSQRKSDRYIANPGDARCAMHRRGIIKCFPDRCNRNWAEK